MNCKNKCQQYKKPKRRYDTFNSRYCYFCDIFMEFDGFRCPCCNGLLKVKPKNKRSDFEQRYPDRMVKRY